MNTYLGACVELGPDDVDAALVAAAGITYLEGYLWDRPEAKAACRKAAEIAHRHGRQVALTLSDPFCVDRWRAEFPELIAPAVDILFANEAEITSLYEADRVRAGAGGGAPPRPVRRADPRRRGLGRGARRGPASRSRRRRSPPCSTPPAPATSTPRACCTASPTICRSPPAAASAACPRPRSSASTAPGPERAARAPGRGRQRRRGLTAQVLLRRTSP